MNIDAKILNIILANRVQHIFKRSYLMSGLYSRNARILQFSQINQCDTPY